MYRRHGLAALSRRTRTDKNTFRLSPELLNVIEGLALQRPAPSIATIHRETGKIAKKLAQKPPCYSVIYRIVKRLDPALTTLAQDGSRVYSNTYDLIHRTEAAAPNAIWQADHTQLDILVKNGSKSQKPWLTIILDDYSRAVAGYALSFQAPSAIQTALALRHAIWRKMQPGWQVCGLPEILYTDHGADFTSKHMQQVAADLKIQLIFSSVGQPRGRGKIERFFRSISQILLPGLPGFSPPGAKSKRRSLLTLAEVAREVEDYIVTGYHATPHSATGAPPKEQWARGGFIPRMPESLSQLDLLLLTVPEKRVVHTDGIRFSSMRYMHPLLASYIGENVVLRYDPRDVSEIRIFFQNRFLCHAVCQELAGQTVPLREIVTARNRRKRELKQTIEDRRVVVNSLLDMRRGRIVEPDVSPAPPKKTKSKLKRYRTDE